MLIRCDRLQPFVSFKTYILNHSLIDSLSKFIDPFRLQNIQNSYRKSVLGVNQGQTLVMDESGQQRLLAWPCILN